MSGTMRYDGSVSDTGTSHISKANELINLFEDLKRNAQAALGDHWQGTAADAFDQAQVQWNATARELGDGHTHMGQTVVQAAQNIFDADAQGARMLQV